MAAVNLYVTKSKYFSQLPVRDGNIIFATDVGTVGFDYNGSRLYYDTIRTFETEENRLAFKSPLDGYYIVQETNMFWYYHNKEWKKLCPDNLEPLFFGESEDDFPAIGNPTSLYVANEALYKWDNRTQSYMMVSNLTKWDEFTE